MTMEIRRNKPRVICITYRAGGLDRLLDDKRKAPCCLMAAWGFALGDPLFFERKCFPDRLGLGLILSFNLGAIP